MNAIGVQQQDLIKRNLRAYCPISKKVTKVFTVKLLRTARQKALLCQVLDDTMSCYFSFGLKSGLTCDLLGFISGIDGLTAKRNQTLGLAVLKNALAKLSLLPKRSFDTVEEFHAYFEEHKKLIFDAMEQGVQLAQDNELQKEFYSSKKRTHCKINAHS